MYSAPMYKLDTRAIKIVPLDQDKNIGARFEVEAMKDLYSDSRYTGVVDTGQAKISWSSVDNSDHWQVIGTNKNDLLPHGNTWEDPRMKNDKTAWAPAVNTLDQWV